MQGLNTFIPNGYQKEDVSKPVTPGEDLFTPSSKL